MHLLLCLTKVVSLIADGFILKGKDFVIEKKLLPSPLEAIIFYLHDDASRSQTSGGFYMGIIPFSGYCFEEGGFGF